MSTGAPGRAEEVFLALVDLPRQTWDKELALRCGRDSALVEEVRSLLDCHARAEGFLDAAELTHVRGLEADEALPAGTRIGEYVIQSVLGRGGMGTVYVAEQTKPRR